MKLAFILDPIASIKTKKDSSFAMMREANARNYQIFVMQPKDIALKYNIVVGQAHVLQLLNNVHDDGIWYQIGESNEIPLQSFDAILMRKDPPFDMEYLYCTYLLELAEQQGACIFNRPQSIRNYNEKISIARFPQFIPPTLVTKQECLILDFLSEYHDIILKPLDSMGGAGIFRVKQGDHNVGVILETLTRSGNCTIMAQQFLPDISKGDKRIIVIAGKVVPYALARIPKPGETRANLAVGGTGKVQPLTPSDFKIAEELALILHEEGLILAGLDIIGDFLTEINVTSPTGMQEITQESGVNVAALMLDAVESHVQKDRL